MAKFYHYYILCRDLEEQIDFRENGFVAGESYDDAVKKLVTEYTDDTVQISILALEENESIIWEDDFKGLNSHYYAERKWGNRDVQPLKLDI